MYIRCHIFEIIEIVSLNLVSLRSLACYQEINIKTKKGKKLKTEKLEYEMQLHHIRILLSQAFFLSVSALLSKEKIQKPQIISTQIGNRQNVSLSLRRSSSVLIIF